MRASWRQVVVGVIPLLVVLFIPVPAALAQTEAAGPRSAALERPVDAALINGQVPFYRLYSPRNGDHFHTTNAAEVNSAAQCCGYLFEALGAILPNPASAGLVPFYRLYNPRNGDHFHTVNWSEVISATRGAGYLYESIGGYVYPPGGAAGVPFYRLWNPGNNDHFHTTNWQEVLYATLNVGYVYEGVGARVEA